MQNYIAYNELIAEIEQFYTMICKDDALAKFRNKYLRGIQVLYSPMVINPDFLFIGINPGTGYYNQHKKNVKRFNPLKNFEYNHFNYLLARETKKVFKIAGLSEELKKSVKTNCFFFSTKNERELHQFLSHLKGTSVYPKSRNWLDKLINIIRPKIIICEGKSALEELLHDKEVAIIQTNGIFYAQLKNIHIIGYSRRMSFIKNKEKLAAFIKIKFDEIKTDINPALYNL